MNQWETESKIVYTIFSAKPEGFKDILIEAKPDPAYHYVDLWHHKELQPKQVNHTWWIEAETDAFNASLLGTNNEGEVDCIARLPKIISYQLNGNALSIEAQGCSLIKVWAGAPSYEKEPLELAAGSHTIQLNEKFGRFEGKIIIQAFEQQSLKDETVLAIAPGTARLISRREETTKVGNLPSGMVRIPSGKFVFKTTHGDEFISYPKTSAEEIQMSSFLMDKFPVTMYNSTLF